MESNGWDQFFQSRLADVARTRGITNSDLADAIHVHQNTILRWRSPHHTPAIPARKLYKLSKHLGICPALWFVVPGDSRGSEEKLQRILDYVWGLDECKLERFLNLVDRIIDFVEGSASESWAKRTSGERRGVAREGVGT
jgi:hypothetical protein